MPGARVLPAQSMVWAGPVSVSIDVGVFDQQVEGSLAADGADDARRR